MSDTFILQFKRFGIFGFEIHKLISLNSAPKLLSLLKYLTATENKKITDILNKIAVLLELGYSYHEINSLLNK